MARKKKMQKPSFFKIMLDDFTSQLRVPVAFVKHLKNTFPTKFILQLSTGSRWSVELKKCDDQNVVVIHGEGWRGFVKHNGIEFGDLLVFWLLADTKLYVNMYDKTCCEKRIKSTRGRLQNEVPARYMSYAVKGVEAANQFSSEFPFFIIRLSKCYVERSYVVIPKEFAETYLSKARNNIVRILDSDGREWFVDYSFNKNRSPYLCNGWQAFVRKNKLNEGCVCAFELVDGEDVKLKFSLLN